MEERKKIMNLEKKVAKPEDQVAGLKQQMKAKTTNRASKK